MKTFRQLLSYLSILLLFSIGICSLWGIPILMFEFGVENAPLNTVLDYIPRFVTPIMFWSMLLFFGLLMCDIICSYFDTDIDPEIFEAGNDILDIPIQ